MPEEHLTGLFDLGQLDAEYITSEILTLLSDAGYSADNILVDMMALLWTSHYEVTRCIVDNKDQILSIQSEMTDDDDAAADLCTEASGLLCQIKRQEFEPGTFIVWVQWRKNCEDGEKEEKMTEEESGQTGEGI
ncbi:hypothetical protein CRENBAI_008315, partial [Crenichthys baileyi]